MKMKSMSEKMKLRFNAGQFGKFHGKQSSDMKIRPSDLYNLSEDMVCEWLVVYVKEVGCQFYRVQEREICVSL